MQGKDDSAFAPSYEADPGSIPVGAPYASYPVAQEGDGGYQEPPFSGSQTRGVYCVVWLLTQSAECVSFMENIINCMSKVGILYPLYDVLKETNGCGRKIFHTHYLFPYLWLMY